MDLSNKKILLTTLPVLVSMLVEQLIGITDTAFIGRVGEVELGASAIASVFYLILFVTGSGFGVGLQVLLSRLNGQKKHKELLDMFNIGFLSLLGLSLIVLFVTKSFLEEIVQVMVGDYDICTAAVSYLDWRIFGLPFAYIITAYRSYYLAITKTRVLTVCSVLMVIVNIICNYIFIFGKCGMPVMGIAGAGLGSSIAEFSSAVAFFVYKKYTDKRMTLFLDFQFQALINGFKRICRLSVWTMAQSFLSVASWMIFFLVIERLGTEQLAASNIVRSVSSIPFMIVHAFSVTGSAFVGNAIGDGGSEKVLMICRKATCICAGLCLPILLLSSLFPHYVLRIFTDNIQLIDSTIGSFYVLLSSYLITIPALVYFGAVSGTGATKESLKIELISLVLYMAYILTLGWVGSSVSLLWTSEHVYSLLCLIISWKFLVKGTWKDKRI